MPKLVETCHTIAAEMMNVETNDPVSYIGTPDDSRIQAFVGDILGPIHIGSKETNSHVKVTDLE